MTRPFPVGSTVVDQLSGDVGIVLEHSGFNYRVQWADGDASPSFPEEFLSLLEEYEDPFAGGEEDL